MSWRRPRRSGSAARSTTAAIHGAPSSIASPKREPFLKFERLLETYLEFAPRGFRSFRMALPLWLKEKLFQKRLLAGELAVLAPEFDWEKRLLFAEHHQSHAASAFFPSPFEEAVVLTMDGVGEWATTSLAFGAGRQLETVREIHFPHSLGLLYSAFTYYTGFKVNSGEYKVMGLAPYGRPRYVSLILGRLVDLKSDGTFRLNQEITRFIRSDLMKKRLAAQGARAIGTSRAEFLAFMRAEQEKWGKVLSEIKLKPE